MQIKYKGFVVRQHNSDPHVMIFKNGVCTTRASFAGTASEEDMRNIVDDLLRADETIRKMRAEHAAKNQTKGCSDYAN